MKEHIFKQQLASFQSTLIIMGFKEVNLYNTANPILVYTKNNYIIQIKIHMPIDIRTWYKNTSLTVYTDFKIALENIITSIERNEKK